MSVPDMRWWCPYCGAEHAEDTAREECWDCEAECCESCAVHTEGGIACPEHAEEGS